MGNLSKSLGYDRGFNHFEDLYKDPDIVAKRATTTTDSEELEHENQTRVALPRAEDLTDHMLDWLNSHGSDDYFMFCWSIEPHIPYDPPPGFREFTNDSYNGPIDGSRERLPDVETDADLEQLRALYDGEIRYNDAELGRLIDHLRERGEYDETMIIVCGDHGDAFNEHGQLTHGHLPYDELSHVPLVIKPPVDTDVSGETINEITSLIDIAPTVLEATDTVADEKTIQGRALPPFGPTGSSSPVFSETRSRDIYPAFYSVRTERWKYMEVDKPDRSVTTLAETVKQVYKRGLISEIIRNPLYYYRRYRHDQDRYLYDLLKDPNEKDNLIEEESDIASDFESQLQDWLEECESICQLVEQGSADEIDEATDTQLRQLGYIN
jgi:arylsulfatase A-like enzyme